MQSALPTEKLQGEIDQRGDPHDKEHYARNVFELHAAGTEQKWSDFAVLCRTSRLFVSLQEAFAELAVPVEVVGATMTSLRCGF